LEHLLLYQDDAKKINQFYIKLLKPLPGWRLVSQENWFESLAKEYKKRDLEVNFPVPSTSSTILTIPLLQRLKILRNLCEFHLEQPEHFWELLRVKDGEADWRIEPIAKDSQNRRYWLFSDARLYREIEGIKTYVSSKRLKIKSTTKSTSISSDIENETNWELVCLTRADYDELLKSLEKEKFLLKLIREEIIPKVEPILNFQLSQHKKYFRPIASERIYFLPRKRSSRLLEKELEEEQRRLEREEADKEAERERQALRREQADLFVKSNEQVERDLTEEREMRAEMRRIKKEKEMQIKEIEEAFYSNLKNEEENVEIISEDEDENEPEKEKEKEMKTLIAPEIPKSPIKLIFKISKPEDDKANSIPSEIIKADVVDIVQEPVITDIEVVKDDEAKSFAVDSLVNVTENEIVFDSNPTVNVTENVNSTPIVEPAVEDKLEQNISFYSDSSKVVNSNVTYEDADLLNSLSNN
jgi:hypothetical protein